VAALGPARQLNVAHLAAAVSYPKVDIVQVLKKVSLGTKSFPRNKIRNEESYELTLFSGM
jgi:hypothetical protein